MSTTLSVRLPSRVDIPAGETRQVTFLFAWHFPNRQTWTPAEKTEPADAGCDGAACCGGDVNYVGNYYATRYENAWEAAAAAAATLPELEQQTLAFVRSFCASDLPPVVKEAALYNVSTLRSQTAFRTADGRFYGFEGCGPHLGLLPRILHARVELRTGHGRSCSVTWPDPCAKWNSGTPRMPRG